MSHYKYIQAIRICLKEEHTQDTDYGLYTSGGASEFRWTENTLGGVAETWKLGIIAKDGIGEISESCDFRNGGGGSKL